MKQIKINRHLYRGITFEEWRDGSFVFGYLYIPYKVIPEQIKDKFFVQAEHVKLAVSSFYITPVPGVVKNLSQRTIAFNGAEWQRMEGAPIEYSRLMLWWDYNHYGWGSPTVELDGQSFIDGLIRYINWHGVYEISCPSCGNMFDEKLGWDPEFGAWTPVCPDYKEKVSGYKENHE